MLIAVVTLSAAAIVCWAWLGAGAAEAPEQPGGTVRSWYRFWQTNSSSGSSYSYQWATESTYSYSLSWRRLAAPNTLEESLKEDSLGHGFKAVEAAYTGAQAARLQRRLAERPTSAWRRLLYAAGAPLQALGATHLLPSKFQKRTYYP